MKTFHFSTDLEFEIAARITEDNLHCIFYDIDYFAREIYIDDDEVKEKLNILFTEKELSFTVDN